MFGKYTQSRPHGIQETGGVSRSAGSQTNWSCKAASNNSRKYEEDDGRCAHHFNFGSRCWDLIEENEVGSLVLFSWLECLLVAIRPQNFCLYTHELKITYCGGQALTLRVRLHAPRCTPTGPYPLAVECLFTSTSGHKILVNIHYIFIAWFMHSTSSEGPACYRYT